MNDGRHDDALRFCDEYLTVHPGSVPHLQITAHLLIRKGNPDGARKILMNAISIAPGYAPLHEDMGNLEGQTGNFDAAIKHFRRSLQIDPSNTAAHRKLARALADAGRSDEVDGAIENFLDHDEDAAMVVSGVEHFRAGRRQEAEAVLEQAVRKNPENVDALRFLAMVYHQQSKQLSDAEALLRRAVSIAPDYSQAYTHLGRVLIDNGKHEEAVATYEKLIQLAPGDDDAWAGLGRAQAYVGRIDSAAEAYRKSLSINDSTPSVHMALAHMLKTLGQQQEALHHYRAAIKLKPELGESYWSMANLKTFRFEDTEIDAMQAQLRKSDLPDQARVNLEFSLGKAFEDRQDYNSAWLHYSSGNRLQRSLVDYDPVEHELHLQDIRQVFEPALFDQFADAGHQQRGPIFIVGLPRSGSTLIEQILSSHSQVEGTAELPNLAAIATSTGRYRHDGLTYPATVPTYTARDFAAFGREYLQQVAHHRIEGTPLFIDKMPNNFIHVGWIKLILPDAIVINTRRHPVDSCLGAYKQLFAKGQHFTYDMLELSEFYRTYVDIMAHWHEVLPGFVLDVHYENTVTDLESQVRKILDFCGLEFEKQCLTFHETERAIKTASSEQVRQPIYTDALGLWKKYGEHVESWSGDLADIIAELPQSIRDAAN